MTWCRPSGKGYAGLSNSVSSSAAAAAPTAAGGASRAYARAAEMGARGACVLRRGEGDDVATRDRHSMHARALPYAGPPPPCAQARGGAEEGGGGATGGGLRWAVVAVVQYRNEYTYVNQGSRMFWGIIAMIVFGLLLSALCLAVVLRYWRTNMMRLAQRAVMVTIVLSAATLQASLFAFLGPVTPATCQARLWTISLSLTNLAATLVLKVRRVQLLHDSISNMRTGRTVNRTGGRWFGVRLSAIVALDIALLATWTAYAPVVNVAGYSIDSFGHFAMHTSRCTSAKRPSLGAVFAFLQVALLSTLLAFAGYLSYKVKTEWTAAAIERYGWRGASGRVSYEGSR